MVQGRGHCVPRQNNITDKSSSSSSGGGGCPFSLDAPPFLLEVVFLLEPSSSDIGFLFAMRSKGHHRHTCCLSLSLSLSLRVMVNQTFSLSLTVTTQASVFYDDKQEVLIINCDRNISVL